MYMDSTKFSTKELQAIVGSMEWQDVIFNLIVRCPLLSRVAR